MVSCRSLLALCSLVIVLAVVQCKKSHDEEWEDWKSKHGKNYKDKDEEHKRKEHHKRAHAIIEKHNEEYASGKHTYWLAHNSNSDMSPEERRQRSPKKEMKAGAHVGPKPVKDGSAPTTYMDWTTTAAMPPVRNQQQCGSCWAFSSADTMAYYYGAANGLTAPTLFSTQQLVDCGMTYQDGSHDGCNGGNAVDAYTYVQKSGIDTDAGYPYVSGASQHWSGSCNPNPSASVAAWTDSSANPLGVAGQNDEVGMATYVGSTGPGVVGINAVCDQFNHYGGGILSGVCASCTINGQSTGGACNGVDHDVMIVGYLADPSSGQQYYKIKNSWDTTWGAGGYFLLAFGNDELQISQNGVQYPVGIGKAASAAESTRLKFCNGKQEAC